MAIPERAQGERWQDVLGVPINATQQQVVDAWRSKVKAIHANGDDHEELVKVNLAYDEAKKLFAAQSE
jgi:curved DNA-binding protein CbpA